MAQCSKLLELILRIAEEDILRDFRNLDSWHKAHAFTLHVFRVTEGFPKVEAFGLGSTFRRESANLSMKIAEACGRDMPSEFLDRLGQARAMGVEVEYMLLLGRDLQFMKPEAYEALQAEVIEVRKMLSGLMKSVAV